jgi:peptide chain release factor 3
MNMALCTYENFPVHKACWVKPNDAKNDESRIQAYQTKVPAKDKYGQLVSCRL